MENFKQTKRLEWFVRSCVLALVALVCVAVFSFVKLGQAKRKDAEYDALIASLTQESKNINAAVEGADDVYYEEQARNNLGMIKGDEIDVEFIEK